MPKTKISVPRISRQEAMARKFKDAVEWQMAATGVSDKAKLGSLLNVSETTVHRWLREPGRINLENLWMLYRVLNFSDEQKAILMG